MAYGGIRRQTAASRGEIARRENLARRMRRCGVCVRQQRARGAARSAAKRRGSAAWHGPGVKEGVSTTSPTGRRGGRRGGVHLSWNGNGGQAWNSLEMLYATDLCIHDAVL